MVHDLAIATAFVLIVFAPVLSTLRTVTRQKDVY
jgi:hypothetical protein